MNRVKVLDRQTLFDIALRLFGGADAAFDLALQNGLSVTDQPEPGTELAYGNIAAIDKKTVDYYALNDVNPATGTRVAASAGDGIFDNTFDETFE